MLLNFYPPSFFTKLKFSFFSNFFSYKLLDAIRNFGISKNKKKKRTLLAEQLLSLTSFSRNERRFSRVFTSFPFTFEKKDIAGRKAYDWSKKKKKGKKKKKTSDRLISGASSKRYGQRAGRQWRNTGRKVLFLRFLLVPSIGQIALEIGWGRGYVTILGGRDDAPQRPSIEHQHRGASLQSRVSTLTLPVTIARFAQRNVPVRVVVAQCCRTKKNHKWNIHRFGDTNGEWYILQFFIFRLRIKRVNLILWNIND